MKKNNVLQQQSTAKWLKSRHKRTSSIDYVYSSQNLDSKRKVTKVFCAYSSNQVLSMGQLRKLFLAGGVKLSKTEILSLLSQTHQKTPLTLEEFAEFIFNDYANKGKVYLVFRETVLIRNCPGQLVPLNLPQLLDKICISSEKKQLMNYFKADNSAEFNIKSLKGLMELNYSKNYLPKMVKKTQPRYKNLYSEDLRSRIKEQLTSEELQELNLKSNHSPHIRNNSVL